MLHQLVKQNLPGKNDVMRVKSSALYLAIVIALVISVICSALIVTAFFYKSQYLQQRRYQQLASHMTSGINFLIAGHLEPGAKKTFSLFGDVNDSVSLQKINWGLFDIGIAKSFIQNDTLTQVLSIAHRVDSAHWAALYIIDEDRSLSVSGQTQINGDAYLPKAGIREAYVDNQAYQGNKRLVSGHQYTSDHKLPPLQLKRLQVIQQYFTELTGDSIHLPTGSIVNSFLKPHLLLNLKKKAFTLSQINLSGHIIIRSDTLLTIDSTAQLNNILVFAPAIVVRSGFKGSCQLFATDSIQIGPRCTFNYPSCAGVLRQPGNKGQLKLTLGDLGNFTGTIFIADPDHGALAPMLELGQHVTITGQVYVQGMTGLKGHDRVNGSLFTERFIYQSAYTRYENYLINTRLDAPALSHYYLTSDLLPAAQQRQEILQWLEKK